MSNKEKNVESRCIRLPEVLTIYPVSKSTWWNGVKSGRYPTPIKISPRCSAWLVSDILNLINKAAKDVLGK